MCKIYWRLYLEVVNVAKQLTPQDGDWVDVTYLALVDHERPAYQEAAKHLRIHLIDCEDCRKE